MSGGSLDYFYCDLERHTKDFEDKELDELVTDLAELFHEREWYLSGDTGEGSWEEARSSFKKKWFAEGARAERIEKYLEDIKNELLKSFGLSNRYCQFCKHWTAENEEGSPYGTCDSIKSCLMHRSECCEKYEQAENME